MRTDKGEEGAFDIRGAGAGEDARGRVLGEDAPFTHQDEAVAAGGLIHYVARDEEGGAGGRQGVKGAPERLPEHGIEADHYVLFPAFGERSDAKYDFKWVTTRTWDAFGKSYDQYGTGGGWMKARELFEGLLDCDSSRVYVSERVRRLAPAK